MTTETRRASPLSVEDRRAQILDAAIPLLREHGGDVTTRQVADACGIAEGTIFRAFTDKAELVDAALARFMDPSQVRAALARVDHSAPVEERMRALVLLLADRFAGVMGLMAAAGMTRPKGARESKERFLAMLTEAIEPDAAALRVDPGTAARIMRMVAFASAIETTHGEQSLTVDELVDLILHGVLRTEG